MLIDWFTVGAQALNFIILVWLMRRFLYAPVRRAIDAREQKIAAELADAAAKAAEAQKQRDEFQRKNDELEQQRAALLKQATDEASAERHRLLDEARKAADALSARRQESLRRDAQNLNRAIGLRAQQEVFAIARKALADLAATTLEERMAEAFVRRIREMDASAKATLADAIQKAPGAAVVRSAFELPAEPRASIEEALRQTFSADVRLRFETAPELVGGIDLAAGGYKVGWSIADYLGALEKSVEALLDAGEKTEAKAVSKPASSPQAKAAPGAEGKAESRPEAKGVAAPEENP